MLKKLRSPRQLLCPVLYASFLLFLICIPSYLLAQSEKQGDTIAISAEAGVSASVMPPQPVAGLEVIDQPNDGGGAIEIIWSLSPDDKENGSVDKYIIYRATSKDGVYAEVGDETKGKTIYQDNKTEDGVEYFYQIVAVTNILNGNGEKDIIKSVPVTAGPIKSSAQWFNMNRLYCLIIFLIITAAIIGYINKAKSGKELYIRKIAGISAVEEAVGRATEMGKKVFFIPGIQDMNDVQTIAGIAILGRVAQVAAEYETWLEVPVSKSLVMVTARETMKEAYTKVGRPDSFQENQVHYLTDDQFGYAAAIDGMVVREKPATIFYMGAFFAESLILAETGNSAGAIQIAGTAMPSQLPFFVAACDYTLIGEELFAASAYLSREPRQLGSLKGQDIGKAIFLIAIIIGTLMATFGIYDISSFFQVN